MQLHDFEHNNFVQMYYVVNYIFFLGFYPTVIEI